MHSDEADWEAPSEEAEALWAIYQGDCPDLTPISSSLIWFREAEHQERLLAIGVWHIQALQRAKERIERLRAVQAPPFLISREIAMMRRRINIFQHAARLFRANRN